MSDYGTRFEEDARLAILAELAGQRDAALNSLSIQRVLDAFGPRQSPAWTEKQLRHLEDIGAVVLRESELAGFGTVQVATLTATGRQHVERRTALPGVSAPADIG